MRRLNRHCLRRLAPYTVLLATAALALLSTAQAEPLDVEKDQLKFGFIKLTDMAPLAIAYEKGYFEAEGLFVTLEPQANWKVLLDRVITGELDGAHMLAGQPLAATIGFGTKAHIMTPFSMDLNGNGVPVITDYEIWKNNPEKVFGLTKAFTEKNPNTVLALTKALIRAAKWLDENNNANRQEAVQILSRPEYVGADAQVIANSMTGTFEYEKGDKREVPDFNVFYRYFATYPYYSDAVWYLTQMRRWGQITTHKDDAWYAEVAKSVYLPQTYLKAARMLVAEGHVAEADFPWESDAYRKPQSEFIDNITFDGRKPTAYIDSMKIGLKTAQRVVGTDIATD
ncbi:MAG: ABC-type nitrate/sulfonate/bicarbonate transport system substrate-binding protein [Gammaproteobacteria bacterium]|jgi:ABC-type nitrate/sulfonate/bicarbonate transport system substrate-binding protein